MAPPATLTRVNLGPFTTAFLPPSHCSRAALACPTCSNAARGQSCRVTGTTATAEDDTGCWPRATAYPNNGQGPGRAPLFGMGFYSPGIECPTGFSSACTAVSQTKAGTTATAPLVTGTFQFPLVAGETAVGCCPSGYTCAIDAGVQTCHQAVTSTAFDAMTCDGVTEGDLNAFQVPFTSGSKTVATMHLFAPMIQINHQATDLPEEAGAQEATTSSSSSETPLTMSNSPTGVDILSSLRASLLPTGGLPALPTLTDDDNHRLPTSTKIAIACAPLIGGAIILAIMAYFKWRKRYQEPKEVSEPKKPISPEPSEQGSHPESGHGFQEQTLSYSPPLHDDPIFNANQSPVDFGMHGGPGPIVLADGRTEKPTDVYEQTAPPNLHAAHVDRTLSQEDRESPVDIASPFQLQQGKALPPEPRETVKDASPLVRAESAQSQNSDSADWEASVRREKSFSRPRPRPRTRASSLCAGDRTSSVYSWNVAAAAEMPNFAERRKSMTAMDPISRLRPSRGESADSLTEHNRVPLPREGVPF